MYNWHKFWGRKTWNVVGEFIDNYSMMDDIVLDPFSGSGVTALEALKQHRRVIAIDLNPVATEILRLTILPVDLVALENAFREVESKVKDKILGLYSTKCRKCNKEIPIECAIWTRDAKKKLSLQALRYKCVHCGDVAEKGKKPTPADLKALKALETEFGKKHIWYPKNPLQYSDGKPFMKKERYDSLDELFTPRNLYALALIMNAVEKEQDEKLRDFLKIAFTSMVHLCSTMVPALSPAETNHQTAFSSVWTQHSYWFASEFMEQNVWNKFESSVVGHQGLLKAKAESNKFFKKVKVTKNIKQVLDAKADICIITGNCIDVLEKLPARSLDYIFTDPPYDASIQYGELSYLWAAWLKMDAGYVDRISSEEIVRNERQRKDFEVYHTLLRRSFDGMYNAMKLGRYVTLTFHNPTFKIRNATIRAGTYTGFEFEKIHHQPTAQKSGKSLLQPFGSAMGDFYLRFRKPTSEVSKAVQPEEITEQRFEKIVVDTTVELLAERAEPTPYTIVINYIDPVLARLGYFSTVQTGLDVKTVLTRHLGKEFKLVTENLGGVKGKLWWFNNTSMVARLQEFPLSERVEQTVLRLFKAKGRITFTDAWEAVSMQFPNSLTSDSTSIKEALRQFTRQITGGYWLLKPQVNERERQHSEIIAILAQTGEKLGYKIWIGKKEQADSYELKPLESYVTAHLSRLSDISDLKTVEMIDVLWIKGANVAAAFEVEFTTTMTSALVRGSNLPFNVPKYMVIPEEQLNRKMKSPMFAERFALDQWDVLYFDTIRTHQKSLKSGDVSLEDLTAKKTKTGVVKEREANYSLFVEEAS